ncbi:FAD-dependent oxidoreductase [Legionella cardiaca]|uniref:FAD-dependent oxidoreductase n=1 Tax=Legionella cardiaca TaxID=1071983 RepID=A0ABY8ATK8_9GAMM|nr:FAD-dependent oxidoreductase [Legionella cardiaca]WED43999.1 FAD-dependent oxidoreductase [Legionella cardiaca]
MEGHSIWQKISSSATSYPSLKENIEVDVAIIGGGITGITAAINLLKAGKKVAIVEASKVGGVTTSMSTGNLYLEIQPLYQTLASNFGIEKAKDIALSRQLAIDYIETNVNSYNINCQFKRRPWYAYSLENETLLHQEIETLKQMNIDIEEIFSLPFDFKFKKAAVMNNQARFNPLQYVISMATELMKRGCLIYEDTRVTAITENNVCHVLTNDGHITAKHVFMATHTPFGINTTQMFTAPYRSYVVAVHLKENDYPEGHFWKFDNPPYVLCTHAISKAQPDTLMIAGRHHKTGQGNNMQQHFSELENFLREYFSISEIVVNWSAQHYHSADKIPYIGLANHTTKNIYMATGYFADGLVYGTLAGILVSDMILQKSNTFAEIYNANRSSLGSSLGFVAKENLNVLAQYAKDLPLSATNNFENLQVGEGRIVEINREKCAISRDSSNQLHLVSAVCTHMKCIVNWNNAEQTWDCPCHGSRFAPTGEVLEGPATKNLEKKKIT